MSTIDLYDVLNLTSDCSEKQIKDEYRKLVIKYHPDKQTGDAEMFELITDAYNILIDKKSRGEYDKIYQLTNHSLNKPQDHYSMKAQSVNFYKSKDINKELTEDEKVKLENEFHNTFETMDKDVISNYNNMITNQDIIEKMKDLEFIREQEEIEATHDVIFDDNNFDISKFNAAFDEMNKRGANNHLIKYEHGQDYVPWNMSGEQCGYEIDDSGFGNNLDNDYGQFSAFKPVNNDPYYSKQKLSKETIKKIGSADYTTNYNVIDENYNKVLEQKILEFNQTTKEIQDMTISDFTDKIYNMSGKIEKIEENKLLSESSPFVEIITDNDVFKKYTALLENRKNKSN